MSVHPCLHLIMSVPHVCLSIYVVYPCLSICICTWSSMGSPSRGGGVSQVSLPHSFPIFVCPSAYWNLSPILFTHQLLLTYLQCFHWDCPFCLHRPFTYISLFLLVRLLFATSPFLCGLLETRHIDRVPRPVSLEDGTLVTEVTVGLRPLSANTSLWPGLQLEERVRKA